MSSLIADLKLETTTKTPQVRKVSTPAKVASAACLLFAAVGVDRPLTGSTENYFAVEPGTSGGTGSNIKVVVESDPSVLVSELKVRSGLTWAQIAQLFGVTRRAVHLWVEGGNISASHRSRLNELLAMVSQSGYNDPKSVRQWLLSAETGSSRTRFAALTGPYKPLVPEDGRRLADTLGTGEPISAPLGGKVKHVAQTKKSSRTTF